jgi:hypothetical protein
MSKSPEIKIPYKIDWKFASLMLAPVGLVVLFILSALIR